MRRLFSTRRSPLAVLFLRATETHYTSLDIEPTNANVDLWMKAFRCPCVRYFGTNHAIDTCDSFLGRAFVSAASIGHTSCMKRVASFWSAKPSKEVKNVLRNFPSGVLDAPHVRDFLVVNAEHFGLNATDLATRSTSAGPHCPDCEDAKECPRVGFSIACDTRAGDYGRCKFCDRSYSPLSQSLGNGGIKGLCRECYHSRYIACFQCKKQQAHPRSLHLKPRVTPWDQDLVLDVSKLACATCVPPVKSEPLVKTAHFRAANGASAYATSVVEEPSPKRVRRDEIARRIRATGLVDATDSDATDSAATITDNGGDA